MTTRNGYLRISSLGVFAVLSLTLAGCATQGAGSGPGTVQGAQGHALDENLNGFLAQAPAGAVISVAESHWGPNVEVIADESYFSASGRECRQLRVMASSGATHQAVACETASGWESRRLITDSSSTGGNR
ncbi:DVU3141 family protein [Halomonas sp. HK25]|uniref:DVU3141 family protein n=1 Tax=Halomonas sp. HK25 TaxID=3394321 RepID=UPI0039FC38A1